MVAMTRQQIADPFTVNKMREGRVDDIRRCIGCNQGCIDQLFKMTHATCVHNPAAGHELELGADTLTRVDEPRQPRGRRGWAVGHEGRRGRGPARAPGHAARASRGPRRPAPAGGHGQGARGGRTGRLAPRRAAGEARRRRPPGLGSRARRPGRARSRSRDRGDRFRRRERPSSATWPRASSRRPASTTSTC